VDAPAVVQKCDFRGVMDAARSKKGRGDGNPVAPPPRNLLVKWAALINGTALLAALLGLPTFERFVLLCPLGGWRGIRPRTADHAGVLAAGHCQSGVLKALKSWGAPRQRTRPSDWGDSAARCLCNAVLDGGKTGGVKPLSRKAKHSGDSFRLDFEKKCMACRNRMMGPFVILLECSDFCGVRLKGRMYGKKE